MKIKKILPIVMLLLVLFTLPAMAAENTNTQTMTNVSLRFNAGIDRVYANSVGAIRVNGTVLAECKYSIDHVEDEYIFRFYNIIGELNVTSVAFYNTVGATTAGFMVSGNELVDACEINVTVPHEGTTAVLEIRFSDDIVPSPGMPGGLAHQAYVACYNHDVIAVSIQLTGDALDLTSDEWRVVDWYGTLNYDIWQTDYDRGYADGYEKGFDDGYDVGYREGNVGGGSGGGSGGGYTEADLEAARADGYEQGYRNGRNAGYDIGYVDGKNSKLADGIFSGVGDFLIGTIGGFMAFELMPNISIGGIIMFIIGISLFIAFIKFFAGG